MGRGVDSLSWVHPYIRVNLLLQSADLCHVLPDGLLQMQDAAPLLLRVAGDL